MDSERAVQNRNATLETEVAAEKQLGNVIERVSDAFVALDNAWRYTYVNQHAGKLFGRRPQDLIGKHIWTEFPEGVGQPFHRAYEKALAEQSFLQIESYYQPWDRWFENRIYPSPDGLSIFFHDITDRKLAEQAAQESSELLHGQNKILELIAQGTPLEKTLEALIRVIEAQSPDLLGSILVLDPDGVHVRHGAAPSLPESYTSAVNGEAIGPRAGSCGTAAYLHKPVIVEDIATDPLWTDYRELALKHGLRACWSTPIFDEQRRVLGTFALYFRKPGSPTKLHLKQIAMATYTAAIAITKQRESEALRTSEERLRLAVLGGGVGIWEWDTGTNRLIWNRQLKEMFGWPADRENLTLADFLNAIHPEDRQNVENTLQESLSKQVPYDIEYRVVWPDGSFHWIAAKGHAETRAIGRAGRMFGIGLDITQRKNIEEGIKQREAQLAEAQRIAKFGSYDWIPGTDRVNRSDELCRIFGVRREEFKPTFEGYLERVHPEDRENTKKTIERAVREQKPFEFEERIVLPDGSIRLLLSEGRWIFDDAKKVVKLVGICQDITARREEERARAQLEEQLRQVQKMDSIGRLAGGVAHDFNNLLSVMLGYSELCQEELEASNPARKHVAEINKAAERAAGLTRQLLAFSRQQVLQPTVLDLNSVVKNLTKMLTRLIGEDVSLQISAGEPLGNIKADAAQVEQVLVNLIVNARDAMPKGGAIFVETANAALDEDYSRLHSSVRPGQYVMLSVTDSGYGMDAKTMAQIFEPFFTTKAPGEGTGLGLSMIYGVVKQSGGHIAVFSQIGKGTTFKIYFPRIDKAPDAVFQSNTCAIAKGSETILLVEDDEALRKLTSTLLSSQGYRVLEANDAASALTIAGQFHKPIDLVLTDVVMPTISGTEMARQLKALHPEVSLLYMSGYTDKLLAHHGVLDSETHLLHKPFTKQDLLASVRASLQR